MAREDMTPKAVKIYQGSDEWSALYIDGKLDYVGDHSNVEERIQELFEIEVECSDSFMLGRDGGRDKVAKTEAEIIAYDDEREDAMRRVMELQEEMLNLRKEFRLR